jgi:hypothetical protein
MRGEATVNRTTAAWVGDGSRIHALDADLSATATDGATATVTSAAVGLISNGDVVALAGDTSTVDAHIGQTTGSASTAGRDAAVTTTGAGETLGVKATLTSPVRATTDVLSISLGVSTSKTRTTAESTPTVRVYAGDRGVLSATGNVELAATASTQVAAKGTGISGTVGVAASGAEVMATLNPSVQAFSERTGALGGRDVKLTAALNVDAAGNPIQQTFDGATHAPAYATVTLGSFALLGGVAGGIVTVTTAGSPEGVVNEEALLATPEDRRPWVPVSAVSRTLDQGLRLPVAITGEDLVRAIHAHPATEYLLVEEDGSIYGVLSTADVDRAFREA